MTATKTQTKRFVVITTEHRGVFAGDLEAEDSTAKTATISNAQMCVYWSADIGGVLGLAASGPSKSCKISPPVPKMSLQAVTAVIDGTPEAKSAWAGRPWG